jgi:hypothetical protein
MTRLLHQWLHCLKLFAQLSVFVSSPANLPYSPACLLLTLLAYLATGFFLLGDQFSLPIIAAMVVIEILLLLAISFIMLKFSKHSERLLQTITALVGVNLFMGLVSIPVFALLPVSPAAEQPGSLTLQINLLLLFWNLAVISLIFKRAFEIRTLFAVIIAFNYFLLYELLLTNLFQ